MTQAFLRLPAVKSKVGLSTSTIYERMAEGTFPRPIPIGARAVAWLSGDIEQWIENQVQAASNGGRHA